MMKFPGNFFLFIMYVFFHGLSHAWISEQQAGLHGGSREKHISSVIGPAHCPDPAVVWHEEDGYYYAVRSKIEASDDNRDPPGWSCWDAAQDQLIISRARKLQDVYTAPESKAIVVDRSSPMGGGWGGISVGAFAVTYAKGDACPSAGFWAPALKHIDGRWFIFATGHRPDVSGEANFVLECENSSDPMNATAWTYRGMLDHTLPGLDGEPIVLPTDDPFAETVTVRENGRTITGQLYYIYSHNERPLAGGTQQLNLARLQWNHSSFTEYDADRKEHITFQRACSVQSEAPVSGPMYDWEHQRCSGCGFSVNEGPTALYGPNTTFIMYSASFCATKYYALGLLEFVGVGPAGFPFLWAKHPHPVFSGDVFDESTGLLVDTRHDAFGLGHNSITVSPDLSESWIVYHGKTREDESPGDREARAQLFTWGSDGRPDFMTGPVAGGAIVSAPSDAEEYAVLCENSNYKGRFCVGLPPGWYDEADLLPRGVHGPAVRSIRLHGGVEVAFYVGDDTRHAAWSTARDCPELPTWLVGKVNGIHVRSAPSSLLMAV